MLRPLAVCAVLAGVLLIAGPAHAEPAAGDDRWALDALNAATAWKTSRGAGVIVAVLGDSHPDGGVRELRGRVEKGPDLSTLTIGDDIPLGDRSTGLASLIAGTASGMAPEARVLSIPVNARPAEALADPEEDAALADSPLARGIRFAVNSGASVICLPSSRYGINRMERDAVAYALARGAVLVAAVGDDGQSAYTRQTGTSYWRFPAGYPGVVGVAAVDRKGAKAGASSDNLSVLVAAPGAEVPAARRGGGRDTLSGTDVASALVSGVVALIKAKYPDIRPELVARALTSTSRPHPPAGYDDKVGFGVVDAAAALGKAGELLEYGRSAPVDDDAHFGKGAVFRAPARPGPDPVRLWIYGIAIAAGIGGFAAGVIALTRR
ncbi:S8 family serine peptidase [Microbispora sp. RL4-1S]|uniref:S8 family serine peptidase n=1 Tax=Microbispora oryzae TaxID=2806554 RepID=A0A940WQB1_9ACTN|nr:S8 family serine peptidase [Microbispora oryzae]MBP2707617.1 S8 family serine peptidase [Microbispora oryzae]